MNIFHRQSVTHISKISENIWFTNCGHWILMRLHFKINPLKFSYLDIRFIWFNQKVFFHKYCIRLNSAHFCYAWCHRTLYIYSKNVRICVCAGFPRDDAKITKTTLFLYKMIRITKYLRNLFLSVECKRYQKA